MPPGSKFEEKAVAPETLVLLTRSLHITWLGLMVSQVLTMSVLVTTTYQQHFAEPIANLVMYISLSLAILVGSFAWKGRARDMVFLWHMLFALFSIVNVAILCIVKSINLVHLYTNLDICTNSTFPVDSHAVDLTMMRYLKTRMTDACGSVFNFNVESGKTGRASLLITINRDADAEKMTSVNDLVNLVNCDFQPYECITWRHITTVSCLVILLCLLIMSITFALTTVSGKCGATKIAERKLQRRDAIAEYLDRRTEKSDFVNLTEDPTPNQNKRTIGTSPAVIQKRFVRRSPRLTDQVEPLVLPLPAPDYSGASSSGVTEYIREDLPNVFEFVN